MSNDELKQYLIDANLDLPAERTNNMVDNGFINNQAEADEFIAQVRSIGV